VWPGVSVVAAVPQRNPCRQWDWKIKTRPDELGQLESTILDKPESVGVKLDHVERPQSQLTAGRFARGKLLEEGDATPDEQSLQTQEF
jgi:hypothetical protein